MRRDLGATSRRTTSFWTPTPPPPSSIAKTPRKSSSDSPPISVETELSSSMREFLRQAGCVAVVDGGLATELEWHGADLKDPLWRS
ncbi:putative homocysteine S-methyltransferase [Rosa chinensis]|uniref:Putative homocysteine S-methyltransferase n=1 Tax=Rosa chinensis TaxID=74649 RepID=A0A2P6SG07_ROSCH|nr:putative homocysteine S-methyltransferase [Rosa chinensis]